MGGRTGSGRFGHSMKTGEDWGIAKVQAIVYNVDVVKEVLE